MLGFSKYFWLTSLTFTLNQFMERAGLVIPIVHSYLDDVLCPGIVLGFALAVQQQLTYRSPGYLLTRGHILFFVGWYGLLFEVLFPLWDSRHHADPWDIVAYAMGALLFQLLGNRKSTGLWLSPA